MEFLEGMNLETLVARRGPLPANRTVHILRQVCESLEEAHEAGLVHRDFKPDNVLVGTDGRARVADFGLASARSHEPDLDTTTPTPSDSMERTLTRPGAVMGTPAYMAPEQFAGELVDGGPVTNLTTTADRLTALAQVAGALDHAHLRGIVHCDVKPSNVFLSHSQAGRVTPKLLDFGIAKALEGTGSTLSGLTLGTPAYMAPEQALGCQGLGPSTDVWAVGVVLVRCLTGRLPFDTAPVGRFEAMRRGLLDDELDGIPASIAGVCRGALRLEPGERIPDMPSLLAALRGALEDSGAGASWPAEPSVDFGENECELAGEVGRALERGSDESVGSHSFGRPSHVLTWTMSRSLPRFAARLGRRGAPILRALVLAGLVGAALLMPDVRRVPGRKPAARDTTAPGAFAELGDSAEARVASVGLDPSELISVTVPAPLTGVPVRIESPADAASVAARHSRAQRRSRPTASEKREATTAEPIEPLLGPNRAPIIE
jgi:tRNA A-37 threonylcarbamoyl transferase component Bud32